MLTNKQLEQIRNLGIDEEQIKEQLNNFKEGFLFAELDRPATIGDGIIQASDKDIELWTGIYDEFAINSKIVKFVPASGAATRMFVSLFEFLEKNNKKEEIDNLIANISKFAFGEKLNNILVKEGKTIQNAEKNEIIQKIIGQDGLNYSKLPKGLLLFHKYKNEVRTATEEHLVEGLLYAASKDCLHLHFTISNDFESDFKLEFARLKEKYEKLQPVKIDISYSFQKKHTDTIASDLNNDLFIDSNGLIVFRPGGHGAILENLNDIDADLIFIKNIDNVAPDHIKPVTVRYKKILAGLLVQIKIQVNDILNYLDSNNVINKIKRHEIADFMNKYLGIVVPKDIDNTKFAEYVKSKIDKPIRVCGMVKNAGEPGGGPFWVLNRKGELRLQIIESSQVDPNNSRQQEILKSATHFNPVDIVCYTKDYTGHKFDLLKFRDSNSGFITEKTIGGKKIKAQELPGLWNGGMAHWITVFVEVPLATFSPTKTVFDLLRKDHQPNIV
jgi:Domain of unknown function (DUF4301)